MLEADGFFVPRLTNKRAGQKYRKLIAETSSFDDYDRMLLYLWNDDDVFVNLALVEGGFAEAIRVQPNDLHFDTLRAAEDAAAGAGLGMWSC